MKTDSTDTHIILGTTSDGETTVKMPALKPNETFTEDSASDSQSIDAAEARANARLIVAAPDLLEALIRLLNIPYIDTESGDACDQARAAIAKTKGDVDGQRNGGK
jgi:hypothetical protein